LVKPVRSRAQAMPYPIIMPKPSMIGVTDYEDPIIYRQKDRHQHKADTNPGKDEFAMS
jgi:hypothetical protein